MFKIYYRQNNSLIKNTLSLHHLFMYYYSYYFSILPVRSFSEPLIIVNSLINYQNFKLFVDYSSHLLFNISFQFLNELNNHEI